MPTYLPAYSPDFNPIEQAFAKLKALLRTAAAFLDGGSSVEATGRALFLHPNTVRYRLRKVSDTIGYDVTTPRDAQVIRVALVLGRTRAL